MPKARASYRISRINLLHCLLRFHYTQLLIITHQRLRNAWLVPRFQLHICCCACTSCILEHVQVGASFISQASVRSRAPLLDLIAPFRQLNQYFLEFIAPPVRTETSYSLCESVPMLAS